MSNTVPQVPGIIQTFPSAVTRPADEVRRGMAHTFVDIRAGGIPITGLRVSLRPDRSLP